MSLAESLARHAVSTPQVGSKIGRIVTELDPVDRDALLAALSSQMPHRAIARALTDEGWPVSEKAVASWREAHGWVSRNG